MESQSTKPLRKRFYVVWSDVHPTPLDVAEHQASAQAFLLSDGPLRARVS